MGFLFSKIFNKLAGEKEVRILILGLDNAGKTTLLYKMQLNNVVQTVPTIGVNVENVEYRNLKFQAWDVGGQASIRPYWRSYYPKTNAIIYMIDSSDRARMKTSKEELMLMLEEQELKGVPLVLLANKQDLSNAMTEDEISEGLGLSSIKEHQWAIFRCSAITGFGVDESMEWMTNIINSENKS